MISHLRSPTGQQKIIVIQKREKTTFGRARKQDGDQFVKPQVEGGNPDVQTAPALADPWQGGELCPRDMGRREQPRMSPQEHQPPAP